jgi:hypothetical protein
MGTVAAPLLAGFSLATLAVILTADAPIKLADPASFALSLASAAFILCIQFTFTGLLYSAQPGERSAWQPHAAENAEVTERMQQVQRKDHLLQGLYLIRARLTYDIGIVSLLGALLAIVAPSDGWMSWRGASFAVLTASLVIELIWVILARTPLRPKWLLPSYKDAG